MPRRRRSYLMPPRRRSTMQVAPNGESTKGVSESPASRRVQSQNMMEPSQTRMLQARMFLTSLTAAGFAAIAKTTTSRAACSATGARSRKQTKTSTVSPSICYANRTRLRARPRTRLRIVRTKLLLRANRKSEALSQPSSRSILTTRM